MEVIFGGKLQLAVAAENLAHGAELSLLRTCHMIHLTHQH